MPKVEAVRFTSYCREKGYKKSSLIARFVGDHLDRETFNPQTAAIGNAGLCSSDPLCIESKGQGISGLSRCFRIPQDLGAATDLALARWTIEYLYNRDYDPYLTAWGNLP